MLTTDGPPASLSVIYDKLSVLYALLVLICCTAFPDHTGPSHMGWRYIWALSAH